MCLHDIFVKVYALLHNYRFIPFWLLTPLRRIVRGLANYVLPIYLQHCKAYGFKKEVDVIVSFTSFPARIECVWQVVECMFHQTYRPRKVILWLSHVQFSSLSTLPKSLLDRQNDLFEIRLVDKDLRSHKKYYYVSKEYPDSLVVLVDDDLYYPTDMIERLVKEHLSHTESLICRYAHKILYHENGCMLPYKCWPHYEGRVDGNEIFFGTGGGVLFKPSQLYKDLTDVNLFLKHTPIADDIWVNAMVRLAGLKIRKIECGLLLPIKCGDSEITLSSQNVLLGKNDTQIHSIVEYYVRSTGMNPFKQL